LKTPKNINKVPIATIDLETIELNNNQIPISISFSYILNNELFTIFELINSDLLLINPNKAVKLLWLNFMSKLNDLKLEKCVIFSHNLGSFDGYFIFKGLLELPEIDINKVNSIIDDLHRFISIEIIWKDSKFIFKDSLRVFPVSLQELCSLFKVEGKLHHYNPLFNKISLFKNKILLNQFIEYARQDSISLLTALIKAQDIYINEHKVDIATIWSTSTLSLKIFRQKFLESNIPILSNKLDSIIRLAYIGGSTDYFYKYGENLKHYDVNSLYPKAMCNPMPMEFLGEIYGTKVKLEEVFGFAEAKITTPEDIPIPLLPFKVDNETLHPLGSWIGVYFIEELKTIVKYGYKVDLIKVYNFSKANIFNSYIQHFYNIKKHSTGPLRFIAKMHLNQLYGYFGRRKTLIETKNVYNEDLMKYYGNYTIFSEIKINENITTILRSSNLDYNLINEIKDYTRLDLISNFRNVKSHVGIAAAVTSYGRIEMMKLKMLLISLGIKIYYTDTDSFFVDAKLPDYLIGKELGQLKDELNGDFIKKAYFLGIKKIWLCW
jgi:DNA polymerase type B, organellar and viral